MSDHFGLVMASMMIVIIDSGDGLSPIWWQAIIWIDYDYLWTALLLTSLGEILNKIW